MFKIKLSPDFILLTAAFFAFAASAFAQDGPPFPERPAQNDDRPDIIKRLGLTPEQIQQFRRLNQNHRPMMNEAQKRLREANRDLDMAIYAYDVSDEVVRARLKAFQEAQADVNRLRFGHEFAIRKILTHDQLIRFLEMRRIFHETRQRNQRQSDGPRRDMIPVQQRDQQMRPANDQKRPNN